MTKLLRSIFEQIVASMERVTVAMAPSVGVAYTRNYCPHCEEETEWVTNTLHRLYFCTQCKRDPNLSPNHYEAAFLEAGSQSVDLDRSNRHVVKPEGHREVSDQAMDPA